MKTIELFREETTSSERLYEGRVLNLRKDAITLPNGHTSIREIVEHRGSICVIPVQEDGTILLVRQFRKATEQVLLELPAGSIEDGEEPATSAKRELLEECGLIPAQLTSLFQCYLAPGYSSELMHVFLAEGLEITRAQPEADEIIETESYPLEELLSMMEDGRIRDAKTISGILAWARIAAARTAKVVS